MAVKHSTIFIAVGVLICGVILLLVSIWFLIGQFNDKNQDEVRDTALAYAKVECQKEHAQNICNNLIIEITPPPDWGSEAYLAYVYASLNRDLFDSSMSVEIQNGKAKVSDFGLVTYGD